ncbi:MAG TPA: NifB/NifX family molybdenum-iron cluster-binding protein [Syntrophobacteraceae bacterium]|nr:NifB/NifX family molybdenum-iron cluster-binding protein [Syntrophobacteraceae bacterium]
MKVCFPTETLQGLQSTVYGHFGSAPGFVIVETDSMTFEQIANADLHHAHGMCQPLRALQGRKVDGVVVGGIGMGALMKLNAQGVAVYRAMQGTVQENLDLILAGKLPSFTTDHTCAGHGGGGGCAH